MTSTTWIVVALVVGAALVFLGAMTRDGRRSTSRVPAELAVFVQGARETWIEARPPLDLSTPEKLAARMELVAQSFAVAAAKKWGGGKLPPAGLVWLIVIEGVRSANTEPPSIFADAVHLVQRRHGPSP